MRRSAGYTEDGRMIKLHSESDFEGMRRAGRLAAETLDHITPFVEAGVTTDELDRRCEAFIRDHGAIPAPLNYRGLPKRFPYAILKNANTDKQRIAAIREENAVIEFLTAIQQRPDIQIQETDIDLKPDPQRVLMLSSYAVDLLQRYRSGFWYGCACRGFSPDVCNGS